MRTADGRASGRTGSMRGGLFVKAPPHVWQVVGSNPAMWGLSTPQGSSGASTVVTGSPSPTELHIIRRTRARPSRPGTAPAGAYLAVTGLPGSDAENPGLARGCIAAPEPCPRPEGSPQWNLQGLPGCEGDRRESSWGDRRPFLPRRCPHPWITLGCERPLWHPQCSQTLFSLPPQENQIPSPSPQNGAISGTYLQKI